MARTLGLASPGAAAGVLGLACASAARLRMPAHTTSRVVRVIAFLNDMWRLRLTAEFSAPRNHNLRPTHFNRKAFDRCCSQDPSQPLLSRALDAASLIKAAHYAIASHSICAARSCPGCLAFLRSPQARSHRLSRARGA